MVFHLCIFFSWSSIFLLASTKVSQTTENGLHKVRFKTSYGEIAVDLPEDMAVGESISGRISLLPFGKKEDKQAKNLKRLQDYILEVAGQSSEIELGWGKWVVPGDDLLSVILRDGKGKTIAQAQIPVFEKAALFKTEGFQCPPYARAGKVIHFYGKFDGDFSNSLIWIGDRKLSLRAETPRRIIIEGLEEPLGIITFKFREGESGGECRYRNIQLESSVGKPVLKKGDTTEFYLAVTGLEGLKERIPITIENSTPELVEMKGSDTIFILPQEVQAGGLYAYKTTLTGIKSGRIKIQARLLPWSPNPGKITNEIPIHKFIFCQASISCSTWIELRQSGTTLIKRSR